MTTVHRVDDTVIANVKGAPQELLGRCTHIVQGGDVVAMSDVMRVRGGSGQRQTVRDALRVLGVACRPALADTGQAEAERDLVLLGLIGMLDPPRPEGPRRSRPVSVPASGSSW